MKVRIASPLHSYTNQRDEVEAHGGSIAELLDDLDRRHPGLRFRIVDEQGRLRPHVRIFVNRVAVRSLGTAIGEEDEIHVLQALSGG
ncbi:Sulfur carrier protein CysO [Myxococcaceae bacterium]|nr:Sulfur carrier protein CysO [Myxococcaceae bacterium]